MSLNNLLTNAIAVEIFDALILAQVRFYIWVVSQNFFGNFFDTGLVSGALLRAVFVNYVRMDIWGAYLEATVRFLHCASICNRFLLMIIASLN